jgi:hypothetical protein
VALGICPTCDKLVTILPGVQKWGTREREWRTAEHENQEGVRCRNTRRL